MRTPPRSGGLWAAVLAVLACVALMGCVSMAPYPAGWASIAKPSASGCSHLSGSYANQGTLVVADSIIGWGTSTKAALLVDFVFRPGLELLRSVAEVRLDASDDGRLGITAVYPDGATRAALFERAKGEFNCRDGAIEFGEAQFGAAYIAIAGGHESVRLMRATDGALIVENHTWGVGTAMLVLPIGFSSRDYARFAATTPIAPK